MKNNQKIILILIIPILIFTSFIAIFISSNMEDNDAKVNNTSNKPIINKKITKLTNFDELYAVQNTVNTIYSNIEKPTELIKYFDNDYLASNNLNAENIIKYLKINKTRIRLTIDEIYYNSNSDITYYFIKGYIMEYSMNSNIDYYKDRYYLLIVDNNNHYSLRPLDNVNNLEEYANNYDLKEISINNNSKFTKNKIEEENKIIIYINNFINLMYLDTNEAYNMLDEETKKDYSNINSFNSNIENIKNKLFTKFWATSTNENNDHTVYKVQDKNHNTITITEYYPNEYKIGFKFN